MTYINYLRNALIYKFIIAYALLTVTRLIFYLFNSNAFVQFSGIEIIQAFFAGFIFDSVFISYSLAPFILFRLFPSKIHYSKVTFLCAKIYYLSVLGLGIILNFIDSIYFSYSQKRTGIELFYLLKDPANSITTYLIDYWYILIIIMFMLYTAYKLYLYTENPNHYIFKAKNFYVAIIVLTLTFIGMRGSLGLKPLKSADASIFVKSGLEALTLNTPFQIISSIDSKQPIIPFKISEFQDNFDSTSLRNYSQQPIVSASRNIVLLVLESFGRDYIGFLSSGVSNTNTLTPFIDSLSSYSMVFPNCYANGTKSIEALPAIFASFPAILEQPFIYSWYQANTIFGQHYYLNKMGYDCSFYHGAINGTMGFESFLKKTGSIEYYGSLQYPLITPTDHDGHWGILDHYYLKYFSKEITKKKKPFFSTVFTLSSHHPYAIPEEFKSLLPKGSIEIHQSIAYTDLSLRMFFDQRKHLPEHNNTIYIIIGDHCSHSEKEYFYTSKGKMELFCMVYDPLKEIKPGINNKIVQQIDILPTILQLANYKDSFFSIGNSFFDTQNNGRALFWVDGAFHLVKEEHIYSENISGESNFKYSPKEFFKLDIPYKEKLTLEKEMEIEMKQLIFLIHKRLQNNSFN